MRATVEHVLRLVLILSLAIAPAVGVRECAGPCADDDAEGSCPAACPDCTACTHAPLFEVAGAVTAVAPAPAWKAIAEERFSARQVDPRKVRHVPKDGAAA